ncbi:hypothetical protein INS49_014748 [Diaporthe citri]|uniref:uncharacterized protein n=1 Tax=Diaporthe citri TaxID=83186 RepID=UPI001C80DD8C|nr:uncharacterized protein INS49_014748 [Diaporthe citri]KAG6356873.1 hypothetical protein INS49_014748 [Diaporthe citri]
MSSGRDDAGQVSQTAAIQNVDDLMTPDLITPSHDAYGRSQPVRHATEGDWAMHRTEIQRLYMGEELPLKEVMHAMKEKHSFHATAKMYKTRLKSWGCRKNISLRDGLDSETAQRALCDSQRGHIRLPNGQTVDSSRLAAHIRRRFQRNAAVVSHNTSPMPHLRAVRPPTTFHVSEAVLFSVRTYILGEYQDRITTAEALDELRRRGSAGSSKWSRFTYAVKAALNEDKFNQALVLMRQAPEELGLLLRGRPANLLSQLFMFLAHVTRRPFSDGGQRAQFLVVVRSLVRYGESLAAQTRLPRDHPLRQLLRALALPALGRHDLGQLAAQAWRLSLSTWDDIVTVPESTSALGEWMNYSAVGGLGGLPVDFGTIIEQTLANLEAKHGERDERCIKALWMHAEYLSTVDDDRGLDAHLDDRILDIFQELLRRGAEGPPRLVAYRFIAGAHRARGERGLAEENLRSSIDVMRGAFGEAEPMVLTYVSDLETWLVEWGETEKATEVGKWREELQSTVDKKGVTPRE